MHRNEIGQRMKQAAVAARLTSEAIAESVGVSDGTIRGWWRGHGQPCPVKLAAYARAVRCSVDWLLTGANEAEPLADWHQRMADLIERGMMADDALMIATGGQVTLTPADRRKLRDSTPGMRADLERKSGGKFSRLSPADQQRIFAEIDRLAEREPAS